MLPGISLSLPEYLYTRFYVARRLLWGFSSSLLFLAFDGVFAIAPGLAVEKVIRNTPDLQSFSTEKAFQVPTNNLIITRVQLAFKHQKHPQSKHYYSCLFGDSISAGVGNTLGKHTHNFALGGLNTVSLVKQLEKLDAASVKCQKAIIAIGANDAKDKISDELFVENLENAIALVHSMGAKRVILIPAFYSTVAASHNPNLAGTIPRVEEINVLIRQVALKKKLPVAAAGIQALYKDSALKASLTQDGVHLNRKGIKIYRQVLLKILKYYALAK